jgi:hypothetical protein
MFYVVESRSELYPYRHSTGVFHCALDGLLEPGNDLSGIGEGVDKRKARDNQALSLARRLNERHSLHAVHILAEPSG